MADPQKPSQQPPPAQASAPVAKGRKILIINHTDSIHRIPIMGPGEGEVPVAESHIVLLPGANAVDPAAWDLVKDYPVLAILRRKKHRGGIEEGDPRMDVKDLRGIKDEEEALELVDQTVDGELLKSWKRTEERPKILEALDAQMEKIDPRMDKDVKDAEKGSDQE